MGFCLFVNLASFLLLRHFGLVTEELKGKKEKEEFEHCVTGYRDSSYDI